MVKKTYKDETVTTKGSMETTRTTRKVSTIKWDDGALEGNLSLFGHRVGQLFVHWQLTLVGIVVEEHLLYFSNRLSWIQALKV